MEIHSPRLFGRIVQSMMALESGEKPLERFTFFENDTSVNAERFLYVVTDPLQIDLNTKKNLNALYTKLEFALAADPQKHSEWLRIMIQASEIAEELYQQLSCGLHPHNELTLSTFLKGVDLSFDSLHAAEPIDKIYALLDFITEFLPNKLIVICNTGPYLSEITRNELLKYICYLKLRVLLIDATLPEQLYENEIRWVIHEDFDDEIRKI